MNNITDELMEYIVKQFDTIKEQYNLSYEKDFNSFATGYVLGIASGINSYKKQQ